MADKRQVIYDIERCTSRVPDACRDCSHYTGTVGFGCMEDLMSDALALLKEQEPVAPVLVGRMWECGKCHAPVGIFMDDRRDQFCRTCGKKVKWDD